MVDRFNGKLRGLIFGVTKEETINDRSLISLTPQAINTAISAETGMDLLDYLATNP